MEQAILNEQIEGNEQMFLAAGLGGVAGHLTSDGRIECAVTSRVRFSFSPLRLDEPFLD